MPGIVTEDGLWTLRRVRLLVVTVWLSSITFATILVFNVKMYGRMQQRVC